MPIEMKVQEAYRKYAREYFQARLEGDLRNRVNNFTELPSMLEALGILNQKKLLDVGCGPGIHAREYARLGANVTGVDVTSEMIEIAKKYCPTAAFQTANIYTLPFNDNSFDIVTASLMTFHLDDPARAFKEVKRVLKDNGKFLYSDLSPFYLARGNDRNLTNIHHALGHSRDKVTGEIQVFSGNFEEDTVDKVPLVSGADVKCYRRMFGSNTRIIAQAGLTIVDYINCFPTPEFEKIRPQAYQILNAMPPYCIYVTQKKESIA